MIQTKHIILFSALIFLFSFAEAQTVKGLNAWLQQPPQSRATFSSQSFAKSPLTKNKAKEVASLLLNDANKQLKLSLADQWKAKAIIHDDDTLRFEYKIFGEKPAEGRSLYISMHGGGNAPARVNDQQWKNQIGLYKPAEGVYLAPRAPTNTWNLWHESHIDTLFQHLIHAAVLFEGVDRNKVYIMGYSAGGDGVYQLAPRMADRWAAAAMMAGHPNETSPLGLRNIGFTLHVGALDNGFNRNEVAKRWAVMLDSLQKLDPGGYKHFVQLHEGRPHWMNREDTVALPWMASFKRNPIPNKVVWKQDDMHHVSFYWLAVPKGSVKTAGEIVASYTGNRINIEKNYSDTLYVRLNDAMMNLDKPIVVIYEGRKIFSGKIKRQAAIIYKTIEERKDAGLTFCSEVIIVNGRVTGVEKQAAKKYITN